MMKTFSIKRDITLITKSTPVKFCRLWGRNALGKLSGIAISTMGKARSKKQIDDKYGDHPVSSLLPASGSDVESLSVVNPNTFTLLPVIDADIDGPVGAMICDVYQSKKGRMKKVQSADAVDRPVDLHGGINGPGIELFYPSDTDDYYSTEYGLTVAPFRDTMTPRIPKQTQKALFDLGKDTPRKQSTNCKSMPALRSTI